MANNIEESTLYKKTLGCLYGGLIGDAMGTPTEGRTYLEIERDLGWLDNFETDGTDDTILRDILADTLTRTDGYATLDDWGMDWIARWDEIFGPKQNRFFLSVLHTARKLKIQGNPRMAALGSIPCSSSAMCMAPAGVVNACNPRQAVLQAYNLASLMNVHDAGFCQDGAAAIAAAVAEAFRIEATVESVLDCSTKHLDEVSGAEVRDAIVRCVEVAKQTGEYEPFRKHIYENADTFLEPRKKNSRETVPITLSLFYIADGDVEKTITFAANFGRDADTMAAMGGAIAGSLRGVDGVPAHWIEKAQKVSSVDHKKMAKNLAETALNKLHQEEAAHRELQNLE